ncbi:MAG: type II secretion system protein [Dechloromonas sp.]|nr:type II secretion system protein [Dechloromonas sp.]
MPLVHAQQPRADSGFTLIEQMITIAILALIAATGLPLTSAWIDQSKAGQAAAQIRNAYNKSRAWALRSNEAWLCLSNGSLYVFDQKPSACTSTGARWQAELAGGSSTRVLLGDVSSDSKTQPTDLSCLAFDNRGWPKTDSLGSTACADRSTSTITVVRGSAYVSSSLY